MNADLQLAITCLIWVMIIFVTIFMFVMIYSVIKRNESWRLSNLNHNLAVRKWKGNGDLHCDSYNPRPKERGERPVPTAPPLTKNQELTNAKIDYYKSNCKEGAPPPPPEPPPNITIKEDEKPKISTREPTLEPQWWDQITGKRIEGGPPQNP